MLLRVVDESNRDFSSCDTAGTHSTAAANLEIVLCGSRLLYDRGSAGKKHCLFGRCFFLRFQVYFKKVCAETASQQRQVTHLEATTINATINMTFRFNTYLPPESRAILQQIQQRILQHIALADAPDRLW